MKSQMAYFGNDLKKLSKVITLPYKGDSCDTCIDKIVAYK